MLAVVLDYTSRGKERQQPSNRFTYHRNTPEALIASASHDENFACALCLLHAQPALGPLHRFRRRR